MIMIPIIIWLFLCLRLLEYDLSSIKRAKTMEDALNKVKKEVIKLENKGA